MVSFIILLRNRRERGLVEGGVELKEVYFYNGIERFEIVGRWGGVYFLKIREEIV